MKPEEIQTQRDWFERSVDMLIAVAQGMGETEVADHLQQAKEAFIHSVKVDFSE